MLLKHLSDLLDIEVCAGDAELADVLRDHGLLALDLEVKLYIVLDGGLDRLAAHCLAGLLKFCDEVLAGVVANESQNKVI